MQGKLLPILGVVIGLPLLSAGALRAHCHDSHHHHHHHANTHAVDVHGAHCHAHAPQKSRVLGCSAEAADSDDCHIDGDHHSHDHGMGCLLVMTSLSQRQNSAPSHGAVMPAAVAYCLRAARQCPPTPAPLPMSRSGTALQLLRTVVMLT